MKKFSAGLVLLVSLTAWANDSEETLMEYEADDQASLLEQAVPTQQLVQAQPAIPATPPPTSISDHCVKSISHLYRFYFHEIYPNPKNEACKNLSETLGPQETAQMQAVVNEVKLNCPAELIGKIGQSFRVLKQERDA